MTKLKKHIRDNLDQEYVDLLESEVIVKLNKEIPGVRVICLQKI
jgi:hypothetical protein